MFAGQIRYLLTCLVPFQYPDDLFFVEPALLHCFGLLRRRFSPTRKPQLSVAEFIEGRSRSKPLLAVDYLPRCATILGARRLAHVDFWNGLASNNRVYQIGTGLFLPDVASLELRLKN
jgi:hypothetical protein